jgi:hypothetical protein
MNEQELHPTFKAVEVIDVKIPFKSCFVLTFKFWMASLLIGMIVTGCAVALSFGGALVIAFINARF